MLAVLVGVVVVLVAAIAFGIAVFGRSPQPATARSAAGTPAVGAPSGPQGADDAAVTVPTTVRLRSGLLLVLASVAIAGFIGAVGSIVVIAFGLFIG